MLLVLEKVALPSSLGQPVYIYQLHDTRSRSHEQTKAWFLFIEKVRQKNTDMKNGVERLVFEMLHGNSAARVEAATIELALREKKKIA
jgi:hypothetical protein